VVIDRIAVIVGRHVIKTSDIVRDLRVTEFLNREPLDLGPEAKRKSAERLIDQEIIRQEIVTGGYRRPSEAEGEAFEKQFVNDRFHGSPAQLRTALAKYGLTEEQLREQLLWQLTVLRFIDQRFRAGVLVTDEEVKSYYDQHLAELRQQNPQGYGLEELQSKIRSTLEGERINQNFNEWLEHERKTYRIEYKQEAFE
jgi:peptidyl-prolyl cis-trans isomerase SurA